MAELSLHDIAQEFWEQYPGPLWIASGEGEVRSANAMALKLGMGHEIPAAWITYLRQVEQTGRFLNAEVELASRYYQLYFFPMQKGEGVLVLGWDITPFHQTESAFLETGETFQHLLSQVPIGYLRLDRLGHILFAEGRIFQQVQEAPFLVPGQSLMDLVDNQEEVRELLQQTFLEGQGSGNLLFTVEDRLYCWRCWVFRATVPDEEMFHGFVYEFSQEYSLLANADAVKKAVLAKALEHSRQVIRLQQTLRQYVRGAVDLMLRMQEMHSAVLSSHARRVARYALALGRRIKLTAEELRHLEMAALLHDIGKIAIPRVFIQEPYKMDSSYRDALRRHPLLGADLVARLPDMEEVATIVRHHHEHFDGSGYPDQLVGHQIPLLARVLAVADAYDNALNGGYRKGRVDEESALASVAMHGGSRFDPELIKVLAREIKQLPEPEENAFEDLQVNLQDLVPGMKISRDVLDEKEVKLLPKDTVLTRDLIDHLHERVHHGGPHWVWIYRLSYEASRRRRR